MLGKLLIITTMGVGALAAMQGGTMPDAAVAQPAARADQANGLCRRAPALAALPPEARPVQQPRDRAEVAGAPPRAGLAAPVGRPLPPPPPPAPEPYAGSAVGAVVAPPGMVPPPTDVVVTGSRADSADKAAPGTVVESLPGIVGRPGRGYEPQSGILTAGEHDDLLNPELYARYIAASNLGQRWRDLPRVDTGRALTVVVTDSAGQPMPLADVVLTCADGNTLSLATLADGTAVFFPELDRLGRSVTISARRGGRALAADRRIELPSAPGPQRVSITTAARAVAPSKFDLLLMVDTTGSMGDEITFLKSEMRGVLASLKRAHPDLDLRVGLLFYRDVGDDYVTRSIAFTSDFDRAQADLRQQDANGGGDYPEAVDQAMNRAVHFAWRPDALKSMLFVADAPPHDELVGKTWAAAEVARAKRIQIVPVAASGVASEAEYIMRAMAAATQSRYLFLTDDSGVGDAHAAPAIDCYLVTKLDALLRRVLDSQISGRRIEPKPEEVIRTVGHYDAGKCRLT